MFIQEIGRHLAVSSIPELEQAQDLTIELVNHPVLMENRFVKQRGSHGPYRLGD